MPSRRAHTKSRLGCIQCKARRVKCDQTYPSCNSCIRHEKTCVYGQVKASTPSSVASKITNSDGSHPEPTTAIASPPGGPIFDSLDLKLMHHFCTSTASSLSSSSKAQEVWRNIVPNYAYTHHMLMHGILTLAANHYVHIHKTSPDAVTLHDYRTRALHHHQLGLQIFRQQVQAPGEDQSHELMLVFAAILGILTFADADPAQEALTFEDTINLLAVIRGKQALWRAGSGMPAQSDLAPAFFDASPPEERTDLSSTAVALSQLHDAAEDDVRKGAISLLKGVAESQTNSEFRMLGIWPAGMSDEFLILLKSRDSIALQTFEHYCTIFDSMRQLWWVGDFGQKLRSAIREAYPLGGTPDATKMKVSRVIC